jgi:hypothetical protein
LPESTAAPPPKQRRRNTCNANSGEAMYEYVWESRMPACHCVHRNSQQTQVRRSLVSPAPVIRQCGDPSNAPVNCTRTIFDFICYSSIQWNTTCTLYSDTPFMLSPISTASHNVSYTMPQRYSFLTPGSVMKALLDSHVFTVEGK